MFFIFLYILSITLVTTSVTSAIEYIAANPIANVPAPIPNVPPPKSKPIPIAPVPIAPITAYIATTPFTNDLIRIHLSTPLNISNNVLITFIPAYVTNNTPPIAAKPDHN